MNAMQTVAVRAARWPRALSFDWLDGLQAALTVVSVVQFGRCHGPAYVWVFVAMVLPALRFGLSSSYRQRVLSQLRFSWASIEGFAANPHRLPWRATGLLVFLPAGLFFLSQGRPLMTGDSKPITLIASALVRDGTTDLTAFVPVYAPVYHIPPAMDLPYFCLRTPTGVHSFYHSGMAVFALPSALLARLLGADLQEGGVQDRMEKGVASWLAAACLGLFFLLALHRVDAHSAALMTLLLATGSGLCSTVGQALWQHGGVLFWMLLALLIEFRTWRRPTAAGVVLQGISLAMMFACRLSSAVFIASFGVWLLLRTPRRAVLVGLAGILTYAPWAWYYHATYGRCFGPTIGQLAFFTGRWRDTLLPLFVSPDHGLLVYQPWILLGLALVVPRVRRRLQISPVELPRGWHWLCLAVIVPNLVLIASWYCWWGGQCWGSRLAVDIIPFFALLCLPSLAALRRLMWGRRLLLATLVAGAFVHLPGVYLKADSRDTQPALFGMRPEPPGSWKHLPFLTPFVGGSHR
ncbi:MAG TPA: hypothetical protein VN688_25725 [Gemmataceae bacterium]|nr:hypothetical protein [Gemmataceae bacterium]